jgi:hypothetical protein
MERCLGTQNRSGTEHGVGTARTTGEAAHQAARSTTLRRLAALGLAGYGVVHLLVAWLALQLAWQPAGRTPTADPGRTADATGALDVLADSPAAPVVLTALALGFAALSVWQAVEVVRHRRSVPPPGPDRRRALLQLLRSGGTALVYAYLAVLTARAAFSGGNDRTREQASARGVLALPFGQLLVLGAAVVTVVIGVYQLQKGWRAAFSNELDLAPFDRRVRRLVRGACRVAFVTKGIAFVLAGGVLGWAALTVDPDQATGLDGAVRTLAAAEYGPELLTAIAVGIGLFSVYCFARARHPVS